MNRRKLVALIASVSFAGVMVIITILAVHAKPATVQVKNSIRCSAFDKLSDGTWHVKAPTSFRIGKFKKITFTELSIGRDNFTFGEVDLYKVLENKCGAHTTATAH